MLGSTVVGGLVGRIDHHARTTPDAIAVIDTVGQITYAALAAKVSATASGLRAAGIGAGTPVLFAVRPGRDALVLGLAVMAVGAVVVVADPGAGPELDTARKRLVADQLSAPSWLAAESRLYFLASNPIGRKLLRRFGLHLPALSERGLRHIYTGPRLPGIPPKSVRFSSLTKTAPETSAESAAPIDDNRPALVVFTSGTTAHPRAVMHSQATLLAGADLLSESLGLDKARQSGPVIAHSEQLMIAFAFLTAGATWSAAPIPVRPEKFVRDLRLRGATHTFGTPAAMARLLDIGGLPDSLHTVLLGAAPVPPPILRRLGSALPQAQIKVVYGATEMLPIAVVNAAEKLDHSIHSGGLAGHPLPGISVRLNDRDELLVQGPHLAIGYLGEDPIDELNTGDVARLDSDGRIVLLGRSKDMLIRGSFNLYPGLYETSISTLPGVAEAAFAGVPDPQTADEVVILAVVPDGSVPEPKLIQLLQTKLPTLIDHAALPDQILCVPAIPRRGRTEKPDRAQLRDLVASLLEAAR